MLLEFAQVVGPTKRFIAHVFIRALFLFRLLMRLVNSMVCVRSMEDTLEQRPNWAVIALQSKVRLGVSLGEQGSAVIIDARVSQESGS